MDPMIAKAQRCDLDSDLRQILGGTVVVNRMIGSLGAVPKYRLRHRQGADWGVTDIPITYDPPVNDPGELKIDQEAQTDGPDLVRCWRSSRWD
jgi:hypothetical protein